MHTSIVEQYKAIFEEQQWLSEKAFVSFWESWEGRPEKKAQDAYEFLRGLMQRIGEEISLEYRGSDAMYAKLRPVFYHLWQLHKHYKKDGTEYYRQMAFCDFKEADTRSYQQSVIVIATSCCPACDAKDGQIISLREAVLQQPIPQIECTRSLGCFCSYGIFGDRDREGNLIMK